MSRQKPNMQGLKRAPKNNNSVGSGLHLHVKKAKQQQQIMQKAIQQSVARRKRVQNTQQQPKDHRAPKQANTRKVKIKRQASFFSSTKTKVKIPLFNNPQNKTFDKQRRRDGGASMYRGKKTTYGGLAILSGALLPVSVIFLVIGGVFWTAHTHFSKVKIEITPARYGVGFSVPITFSKDAPSNSFTFLPLKTVRVEASHSKNTAVYSTKEIINYATGTVSLYNEMPVQQALSEKTRLESSTGSLFYIIDPVAPVIPAAIDGVAGSVEVKIIAATPGDIGNVGLSDFVIPGWREAKSPKFSTQYGRSKTEINGGGVALEPNISVADKDKLKDEMSAKLTEILLARVEASVPADFLVVKNATQIDFESPSFQEKTQGGAKVSLAGFATAVLLPVNTARSLVRAHGEYPGALEGAEITVQDLSMFSLKDIIFKEDGKITGTLEGEGFVTPVIVLKEIQDIFKNRSASEIIELAKGSPSIGVLKGSMRPQWRGRIQKNPEILLKEAR